jgi:hypothetical protein
MYAAGTFTTVLQHGRSFSRSSLFSFSDTRPYTMTSWNPGVNGTVSALAFVGGNCRDVYIGGSFTKVGSLSATDIAEVTTSGAGRLVATFTPRRAPAPDY